MISKKSIGLIFCGLIAISGPALANGTGSARHGHGDEAIGLPGRASQVNRTVTIEMNDAMRFIPSRLKVKQGETIRFVVKNAGNMEHEFVLGTDEELKKHNELMGKFPEMEHADTNMIRVDPGKTGEVLWRFTKTGEVGFACLLAGHFDAGMKGAIKVFPESKSDYGSKSDSRVNTDH